MSYELTGKIKDLSLDFRNEKPILTLEINEKQSVSNLFDELHNAEKLAIKIDKFREKRSLDANSYAWLLIGKLAAKLSVPKEEIYQNAIKQVGDNFEVYCGKTKAIERLCREWEEKGLGWVTETTPSKLNGCTNAFLYFGSSTYNTAQMSRLISIIIEDCKEQGIDTRTPNQVAEMLSLWETR